MQNEYDIAAVELRTIADFLRFGITKAGQGNLWYGHGTNCVQDDIWALIFGLLKLPFDIDSAFLHTTLLSTEKSLLAAQLKRRIVDKVPVPYLTKEAYFAGKSYYVDERVLIPRSPIAEGLHNHFNPWVDEYNVHSILDLCTGSGCIAIAAAYAFENSEVDAVDISKDALEVAKINVARHQMEQRINLIESNLWDKVPAKKYDLIISNPPYVSVGEMDTLPQEYLHEPKLALIAKKDGLEFAVNILKKAASHLSDHGFLVLEVGNAANALVQKYQGFPFMWLEFEHGGEGVCILSKAELIELFQDGSDD